MGLKRSIAFVRLVISADTLSDKISTLKSVSAAILSKLRSRTPGFSLERQILFWNSGIWIAAPPHDNSITLFDFDPKANPTYRPVMEILKNTDKKIFIDIGANVGYVSLWAAHNNKDKKIVAVEPIPWLADALMESKNKNGFENIMVVNKAISLKNTVKLVLGKVGNTIISSNASEYMVDGKDNVLMVDAPAVKLDTLIKQLGFAPSDIALVKIDVEGAEGDVIKSGIGFLKDTTAPIVFESVDNEHFESNAAILRGCGYTKYVQVSVDNYVAQKPHHEIFKV